MKKKELAKIIFGNTDFVQLDRNVFQYENSKYCFVQSEYNFKDNIEVSYSIDHIIGELLANEEVGEIDQTCNLLDISLSDVINIHISKKHFSIEDSLIFNIPFLKKYNIIIRYQRGIFIISRNNIEK